MRRAWLLTVALLAACGGSSPTDPDDGDNGGGNSFSATIDGSAWTSAALYIVTATNTSTIPGGLVFSGTMGVNPARSLAMTLDRIKGPGTYPLGVNTGTTAGGTLTMVNGSVSWWTALNGHSGSITITSLTSSRVKGTFTATLTPLAGGTGTVQVTNGKFDVPVNPGYAPPAADDEGSWIRATIGGTAWNGGTVVGLGGGTGTVGIAGNSEGEYNVSITAGPLTGPGTGPLGSTVPLRQLRVQLPGQVTAWGGVQGDVGTMTITSITAKRVAGTFSGTLAPVGGSGQPLTVTNGSFDVKIGN